MGKWRLGYLTLWEEHGVNHLRANAELWVFENEAGDLGETTLNNRIDSVQLDVFLPY